MTRSGPHWGSVTVPARGRRSLNRINELVAPDGEVDVRRGRHVAEPMEASRGAEGRGRGLRGVFARGADQLEVVLGQTVEGRERER